MFPIALTFTSFSLKVIDSLLSELINKLIKALTSIFGLFQFSVEKAYNVIASVPNSAAASIVSLTAVSAFL